MTEEQFVTISRDIDQILNKHGYQIGIAMGGTGDFEMQVFVEPIEHKTYLNCKRCGRRLKNPETRARGYGEVCWKKHLADNQQTII